KMGAKAHWPTALQTHPDRLQGDARRLAGRRAACSLWSSTMRVFALTGEACHPRCGTCLLYLDKERRWSSPSIARKANDFYQVLPCWETCDGDGFASI